MMAAGKVMAVLSGDRVVNLIWCSLDQQETQTQRDPGGRPVGIGDSFREGNWYRQEEELLTPLEEARKRIRELETANQDQSAALAAIYEGTTEVEA